MNGVRQSVMFKQAVHTLFDPRAGDAGFAVTLQQITSGTIHDGQWITPMAIAGAELTLEVDRPHRIGNVHHAHAAAPDGARHSTALPRLTQSVSSQQLRHR